MGKLLVRIIMAVCPVEVAIILPIALAPWIPISAHLSHIALSGALKEAILTGEIFEEEGIF